MRKAGRQVGAKKKKKRVRGETNAWVWGVVAVSGAPGSRKGRGRRPRGQQALERKWKRRGDQSALACSCPSTSSILSLAACKKSSISRTGPVPKSRPSAPAPISRPRRSLDELARTVRLTDIAASKLQALPTCRRLHRTRPTHSNIKPRPAASLVRRSLSAAPSRFFVVLHPSRSTSPVDTSTQLLRRRLLASPARA